MTGEHGYMAVRIINLLALHLTYMYIAWQSVLHLAPKSVVSLRLIILYNL